VEVPLAYESGFLSVLVVVQSESRFDFPGRSKSKSDWPYEPKSNSGFSCDSKSTIDFLVVEAVLSESEFDFLGECHLSWVVQEGLFEPRFDFQALPEAESPGFQRGHRTD
jgi:hypothetical protein